MPAKIFNWTLAMKVQVLAEIAKTIESRTSNHDDRKNLNWAVNLSSLQLRVVKANRKEDDNRTPKMAVRYWA